MACKDSDGPPLTPQSKLSKLYGVACAIAAWLAPRLPSPPEGGTFGYRSPRWGLGFLRVGILKEKDLQKRKWLKPTKIFTRTFTTLIT